MQKLLGILWWFVLPLAVWGGVLGLTQFITG